MKEKVTAVVLIVGQGRQIESKIQKRYMGVNGRPLIFYVSGAFEESGADEVVLVVRSGECETCRRGIVKRFGFSRVMHIVEGGRKLYHSVHGGLKAAFGTDYVLIHDGARPYVGERIIMDVMVGTRKYGACVVRVSVRGTIKITNENELVKKTPDRRGLRMIQMPQAFSCELIAGAYERLLEDERGQVGITDDIMVVESMTARKMKLIRGGYENTRVTTPENIAIVEVLLRGH